MYMDTHFSSPAAVTDFMSIAIKDHQAYKQPHHGGNMRGPSSLPRNSLSTSNSSRILIRARPVTPSCYPQLSPQQLQAAQAHASSRQGMALPYFTSLSVTIHHLHCLLCLYPVMLHFMRKPPVSHPLLHSQAFPHLPGTALRHARCSPLADMRLLLPYCSACAAVHSYKHKGDVP